MDFTTKRGTALALSEQAEKSPKENLCGARYRNSSVSTGGWSDELDLRWSIDVFAAMHTISQDVFSNNVEYVLGAVAGGSTSYGPNYIDEYRLAASHVDRILKGE